MKSLNCWKSKFQHCEYSDKLLNLVIYLNTIVKIPVHIEIIKKACHVAKEYHGDQKRKSGEPYYSHPLIVAYLFALYVGNKKQRYYTTMLIVIAILHDTIEDTKLTYEMIVEIFGKNVADGVQDLTRLKHATKTTAADTVNLLFVQYKFDILHIKLFDRLHNMRTIYAMKPEKQKKIIEETGIYFIPIASYFRLYEIKEELERLCREHSLLIDQDLLRDKNQLTILYKSELFSIELQNVLDQIIAF